VGDPPGYGALIQAHPGEDSLRIPTNLDASLVLLRHGQSTFIAEDRFQGEAETPLTELGRQQAQLAGTRLARPDAPPALPIPDSAPIEVVHSPLSRAAETAAIVTASISQAGGGSTPAVRSETGLSEIAQGEWEGLHRDEVERRDGSLLATWRARPLEAHAPGGESLGEAAARARPALRAIIDRLAAEQPLAPETIVSPVAGYSGVLSPDRPWTLLVAHDGIFKITLLSLLRLPLEAFWVFPFALCGISIVELRGGRAILRAHNLTEHLAPLEEAAALPAAGAIATSEERGGAL
jgi:broad specificity phosphatase PhoE